MTVFGNYSKYYNLLYKEKNYQLETDYITDLINKYNSHVETILELGCGTGNHAEYLSRKGFKIHGVDRSEEMLNIAKIKEKNNSLIFTHGDIRTVRLTKKFDAALALFHVMSYQTTNNDIINTFNTVYEHLNDNGLFIFDCWYGPGVLTDHPAIRIKRLEDENIIVTRLAEPVMYPNRNVVDVNYQIFINEKSTNNLEVINETHSMRYFFQPEIDYMLLQAHLDLKTVLEFMTFKEATFGSWNACFISQKK